MSRAAKETAARKKEIVFSDFMMNMDRHPLSGDIAKVTNEESIKQSIRNIIMFNFGEKLFQPAIGSGVIASLFEPLDNFTINDIQSHITHSINFFEKRVNLLNVTVQPDNVDNNTLNATIVFSIINTNDVATLNVILRRVR
jgi:phage baseplate assembly protein W